jgi:transposase
MPDADAVLAAYEEVGSVSGLADYFGVPRHTVQGWARRLRREGYDIGRTAAA